MQTLHRTKDTDLDLNLYKKRTASPMDYSEFITEDTIIFEDGEPRVVYVKLSEDCKALIDVLQTLEFPESNTGGSIRTNGISGARRTVGAMPRRVLRADFCHISAMAQENPKAHQTIVEYARLASLWYQRYNPEMYAGHHEITQTKIRPEYQLPETVFTSGIVNKNNTIPYHFDAGNFKNVWSCMLVFKNKVEGGFLSVPEYDMGFELVNNSLFMFDGQSLLHGVTPIIKRSAKAFRYSIVYYSMQQIWNCLPPDAEIERIRKVRTAREQKRAGLKE